MEELYTLGFEGRLTSKGRDKLFKAIKWDYWDEDPYLGGWYVHCEAPTVDKEKFDDFKEIGNNNDYVYYGYLELREVSHFHKSRRYDRLIDYARFGNIWCVIINGNKFYFQGGEENVEKTKDLEPTSSESGLDVEGEKEHLEKLKKEYAKLYDESRGKTIADYAQWDSQNGMAVVCVHTENPDDCEEIEHELRSLASDILQAQNTIAREKEIKRHLSEKRNRENHED